MPKQTPKVIGVAGSRKRNSHRDRLVLRHEIQKVWRKGDSLVSGGCPKGADQFAAQLAKDWGLSILIHHAEWNKYARASGFIRNGKVAKSCDVLIALVTDNKLSGTWDVVRRTQAFNKPVVIVGEEIDD